MPAWACQQKAMEDSRGTGAPVGFAAIKAQLGLSEGGGNHNFAISNRAQRLMSNGAHTSNAPIEIVAAVQINTASHRANNEAAGSFVNEVSESGPGISSDEILADPYGYMRNLPVLTGSNSFNSDDDVNRASDEIQNRSRPAGVAVASTQEQRMFVNKFAPKLFPAFERLNSVRGANGEPLVELIMALQQVSGKYFITGAGLAPQGGKLYVPSGTDFVIHFHNISLERIPSKGDNGIPLDLGVPNFTITYNSSARCCGIYDVGSQFDATIQRQRGVYRSVRRDSSVGDWRSRPEW